MDKAHHSSDKTHRLKNVQECTDTSDCVELSRTSGLHLKPIARLSITVTLPQLKSGQSISNWEVMEKLRAAILPEVFTVIQVTKSTLEFLRFDAEIENKKNLAQVISKIDQKGIKLSGFSELLKIRATEAKVPFPSRHDWDSFFRDAKHMNEMKPGERPDTVHFQDLPCRWFTHVGRDNRNEPSSYVLSKVMASFGEVRAVDIPICDPYRKKMSSSINGIKTFSFGQDLVFEAYVQFKEYIGFAKCMHALQGKKLVFVENDKAYSANIKVDFDRTKHLSEYSIRKRQAERDKLQSAEREQEEKVRKKLELEEMKREAERLRMEEEQRLKEERKEAKRREKESRRKAREEKRRALRMEKAEEKLRREQEEEEARIAKKIALEERKLLIAQRKLESIRLLDEIFERMKVERQKKVAHQREVELFEHVDKENTKKMKELKKKEMKEKKMQEKLALKERQLRDKLVKSYKSKEEDRMEQQREKVRKAVQGQVRMQSGISIRSLSSISSATSVSGSDLSSDTDSDSSSSLTQSPDAKLTLGRMRMDHMDEEELNDASHQAQPPEGLKNFLPYFEKYGYQEGLGYSEDWNYNEFYERGRGRGRGRWRFPRGPWRGRGFRDRGRGFRDRGRGYRGSWQGSGYGYDETKKPLETFKPKTTWYKKGEAGDDSSYSRSRSRSRSRRSFSRSRSRSRRSGSRGRSQSRSKRTRSRSRSKSRSKSRRSRTRSHSRTKHSRSASRSKSNRSRSRSRKTRSRSKSSHAKSHSRSRSASQKRSRSRSRKRSRSRSRSKSRSRSHSRSKRRRHSSSEEHSSRSGSKRRYKHRSERRDDNKKNVENINYEDLRESDLELSSDPEEQYFHDYYPDDEREDDSYSYDYYERGGSWRGHMGYGRGSRGRRSRSWRGRGRGWNYSSYPDYHEHDNWRNNDLSAGDHYRDMYQRYFESLTDREMAEKQNDDKNPVEEERSQSGYQDLKEKDRYQSRERETGHRALSEERKFPPEKPSRDRNSAVEGRLYFARKSADKLSSSDSQRDELNSKKHDYGKNFSEGNSVKDKTQMRRNYEEQDRSPRGCSQENKKQEPSRFRNHRENRAEDHRSRDSKDRGFEDIAGIDERWKTQVMRADLERVKGTRKEVSVKDRLSFVKREPTVVHSKYNPGYDYARKPPRKNQNDARFNIENRGHSEQIKLKDRLDFDYGRERQNERGGEIQPRRGDRARELRERRDVKVYDRDGREERTERKSRLDFEKRNSRVSSESDSESQNEKETRKKREHSESSVRKGKESYESERDTDDDDDDDDESQHKSHHRKQRKNGKKKRNDRSSDRKRKHKKKKKKKDSRRD